MTARGCARRWRAGPVDLVILDMVLRSEDGLELARELRSQSDIGIIMLSGRGDTVDRIIGLEMGADDYLAKPFNPRELLARLRAVLRRAGESAPRGDASARAMRFGGWTLEPARRRLLQDRCQRARRRALRARRHPSLLPPQKPAVLAKPSIGR